MANYERTSQRQANMCIHSLPPQHTSIKETQGNPTYRAPMESQVIKQEDIGLVVDVTWCLNPPDRGNAPRAWMQQQMPCIRKLEACLEQAWFCPCSLPPDHLH
eukprot:scaffold319_cov362-Pavlova_lutheri.AAC.18